MVGMALVAWDGGSRVVARWPRDGSYDASALRVATIVGWEDGEGYI
jgi:hypothetical protein